MRDAMIEGGGNLCQYNKKDEETGKVVKDDEGKAPLKERDPKPKELASGSATGTWHHW
eukprot:GSA25T00002603001.1